MRIVIRRCGFGRKRRIVFTITRVVQFFQRGLILRVVFRAGLLGKRGTDRPFNFDT